MWKLQLIAGCAFALTLVYLWYCNFGVKLRRKITFHKRPELWNKTWAPNPGFNDEFAGKVTGTCGHIRPGEWQCNCEDQTKPCSVLVAMRAPKEPDPEITDRRGLIAAQKARKRNGS